LFKGVRTETGGATTKATTTRQTPKAKPIKQKKGVRGAAGVYGGGGTRKNNNNSNNNNNNGGKSGGGGGFGFVLI